MRHTRPEFLSAFARLLWRASTMLVPILTIFVLFFIDKVDLVVPFVALLIIYLPAIVLGIAAAIDREVLRMSRST